MFDKKEQAKKAYKDFTGHDLDGMEFNLVIPDGLVVFPVGDLTGVMYEVVRDGVKEEYLHQFKKSSRPLLVVTTECDQLFIVGGNYKFKDSGINDL